MTGEPLDANAVVDRLRALYGVQTDTALARRLGMQNSTTVSSWRTRNRVPYDECVEAVQKFRISFDWLLLGIEPETAGTATGQARAEAPTDERMQRLARFLAHWAKTHGEDEKVWLEMQFARAVPEYAEWVAQRSKA